LQKTDLQPAKDKNAPADTIRADTGKPKSGSGGCSTSGSGSPTGLMLILLMVLGLFVRRVRQ